MRIKFYDKENKRLTVIINGEEMGNPVARSLIATAAVMMVVCLVAMLILISLPLLGVEPGSGLMFFVMALVLLIPVLPMVFLAKALKNSIPPKKDEER
jgi:hypothetical protein